MSRGQCLDCEDIIESKHRHDFVRCECGNSFLDGGDDYFRGGGNILPLLDEDFDDDSFLDDDDMADYNLGYQAGAMEERDRILKLIRERVAKAKEYADNGQVTAMQRPVSYEDLYAISEAIIYGIEKESKSD